MKSVNFNLRGIDEKVMTILKKKAEKEHTSINLLILNFIEQSIGYSHTINRPKYHDLDHLAATWREDDAKKFEENTKYFEKIDKDIWS